MSVVIKGKQFSIRQLICLCLYYGFAKHLPCSENRVFGGVSKAIRYQLVRRIFRKCGRNVNVEHGAVFGHGTDIEIGNNSGLGVNSVVPSTSKIGSYVMMGPNVYVLSQNHKFSDTTIPVALQGHSEKKTFIVEDDVWIGRNVLVTPGRIIKKGSVIAGGCVLCKDFPEYSIVGGNPSKLIRSRLEK